MNRGMKTGVQIAGIVFIILICAAIMHFGLAPMLGKGYIAGQKATISEWMAGYKSILYGVAGFALLTGILWYVLARFVFKITAARGVGKRAVWAILFVLNIVGVVLISMFVGKIARGIGLYISHVVLFSVIGYYVSSLFLTPAPYKYTPFGAEFLAKTKK